ncbi:MAG: DNA-formamidopyrimidine glycosylase family protein [Candidatus Omnitrophota bacterium]
MPELPEVETIRRQLVKDIVGKRIQAVKILVPKLIKETSPVLFRRKIIGKEIANIRRRGKYLIFDLKPHLYLQVHLKLSGQLLYSSGSEPKIDHHVLFLFQDGSRLYYHDLRRFGGFTLCREDPEPLLNLGPEPLSPAFTFECWKQIILGKKRPH